MGKIVSLSLVCTRGFYFGCFRAWLNRTGSDVLLRIVGICADEMYWWLRCLVKRLQSINCESIAVSKGSRRLNWKWLKINLGLNL